MKQRKSQPKNNRYYIRDVTGGLNGAVAGSPTIAGANVLANCVGYANGRFNEIINDPDLKSIEKRFRFQLVCNAENFIESAKRQGLKISSKPTLGGIMVWQKGPTLDGRDGAGHVALVEAIYKDGSILTSESGWGSRDWAFKNLRRNNENGRWGQNELYRFRGCIVNPSISGGPVDPPKLVVDGIGGTETVYRMQEFFGTTADGVISGQNLNLRKYYPSLTAVQGGSGGSPCIKKLQKWVGSSQDGVLGQATVKAWQKKLGVEADGIFGPKSMKKWQKYLNENSKAVYPPTPKKYKVIDISEFQDEINWKKAKADGVQGAIIRCGLRGAGSGVLKTDSMFLNHIKGAYKAGVPVGIYMFTEAINAKEGREEADYAIKMWETAGVPISYPIAVDTENVFYNENGKKIAGRANDTKLSKSKRTAAIKAFCERIKEKGYTPMIYASTSWLHNQLDMSKLPYDVWVAQYNDVCEYEGKYVIWQYTSEGRVAGAKGDIDLNHCYIDPKKVDPPKPAPKPTPSEKKSYQGTFPTLRLKKSNAKVIADTVAWALKVAENDSFHYGHGDHAHHNGCYYCGTQKLKKGHGIKRYETTYCCNPFVGAAWAHGGCVPEALKLCESCDSWDFGTDKGSYAKSKLFEKVSLKSLKKGDVLCSDSHVALYIGNGKVVQAGHEDDNVEHSESWDDSIAVGTWNGYKRAYRFKGKVDADMPLRHGEYSTRVSDLQRFLVWYGCKISVTGFFNKSTLEALKTFQKEQNLVADGIAGAKTIKVMKAVKK